MRNVVFRCPQAELDRLDALAAEAGQTRSETLRRLLAEAAPAPAPPTPLPRGPMADGEMKAILAEIVRGEGSARAKTDAARLLVKLRASPAEPDDDKPGDPMADLDELEPRRAGRRQRSS